MVVEGMTRQLALACEDSKPNASSVPVSKLATGVDLPPLLACPFVFSAATTSALEALLQMSR